MAAHISKTPEGPAPTNPLLDRIKVKRKRFCWFCKHNIKYVDYKDPDFLMHFLNDQGKLLPRRITGNSEKCQQKVAKAVKRARILALLPFVTDNLKSSS